MKSQIVQVQFPNFDLISLMLPSTMKRAICLPVESSGRLLSYILQMTSAFVTEGETQLLSE